MGYNVLFLSSGAVIAEARSDLIIKFVFYFKCKATVVEIKIIQEMVSGWFLLIIKNPFIAERVHVI